LALLVLYPIAWYAPLMRAGLLPLFGLEEISVMTGVAALWGSDVFLALLVVLFALVAPVAKTCGLILIQWGALPIRWLPVWDMLGKLAMAAGFLIALYITVAKGVGVGRIETAWGLYLFTFCILFGIALGYATGKANRD